MESKSIEIAAYYFPNYHEDRRNVKWHGQGWTEWELVKLARSRYEGHRQPKIPYWGYEDEADPIVMAKKIDAAADHGIASFIFDWYWYEDGPYLQRALENGFLRAENNERLKFSIMWANHDWVDIHPATRNRNRSILAAGKISQEAFARATEHMIEHYFGHPSYWRVNGGLYFSVYQLKLMIDGFGGIGNTRKAIEQFRTRVHNAGLGDLHLNAVIWRTPILPEETTFNNVDDLLAELGFDSISSYVWIHHNRLNDFPATDYAQYREVVAAGFEERTRQYKLPYFPNVTMGWDSSPRTIQSDVYEHLGYPHMPILDNNSPEQFRKSLEWVKKLLEKGVTHPPIFTINAWNEWTEGSYLEPDTVHGMGYLEAIRDVFAKA